MLLPQGKHNWQLASKMTSGSGLSSKVTRMSDLPLKAWLRNRKASSSSTSAKRIKKLWPRYSSLTGSSSISRSSFESTKKSAGERMGADWITPTLSTPFKTSEPPAYELFGPMIRRSFLTMTMKCSGGKSGYRSETTVFLVRANAAQLKQSVMTLNSIAELRRSKETADFFDALRPEEQPAWVDDLI